MPLLGDTVGRAYLRILADTRDLDRSIRQGVKQDVDGRGLGQELGEEFKEGILSENPAQALMDSFRNKRALHKTAAGISSDLEREFETEFGKGRFSELLGQEVRDAFEKDAVKATENFYDLMVQSQKKATAQMEKEDIESLRRRDKEVKGFIDTQMKLTMQRYEAEQKQMKETADKERAFYLSRRESSLKYWDEQIRLQEEHDRGVDRSIALIKEFERNFKGFEDQIGTRFYRIYQTNDRIGRLFGRGSRNNFLNLMGSSIRGVLNAMTGLAKGFTNFMQDVVSSVSTADGVFGKLRAGISEVALGFATFGTKAAAGFGVLAAALGLLLTLLGPIASLLVGITAAVAALASTISFALVGGIAALGPVLGAMAAAVVTMVLAFQGSGDQLSKFFDPLKKLFDETRTAVREQLFSRLAEAIQTLTSPQGLKNAQALSGVFVNMAKALGDVAKEFAAAFTTPAIEEALKKLADPNTGFPGIIKELGQAAANLAAGLTILFGVLTPFATRLSAAVERVTQKFLDWISTTEGQNAVADFMEKAFDSGKKLLGFLTTLGKAIGKVLFSEEGRKSGNTLFEDMTKAVSDFLKNLDGDKLANFFKQGVAVGRDIGNLFKELIGFINALNTEEAQKNLHAIFEAVGNILDVIEKLSNVALPSLKLGFSILFSPILALIALFKGDWQGLLNVIVAPFKHAWDLIKGLFALFGVDIQKFVTETVPKAFEKLGSLLNDYLVQPVWNAIQTVLDFFANLGQWVWDKIVAGWQVVTDFFTNLPQNILNLLLAGVGLITGFFLGLGGAVLTALVSGFAAVFSWFAGLPGMIIGAIGDVTTLLWQKGMDIINGLWGGMKEIWGSVVSWFQNAITWFSSDLSAELQKKALELKAKGDAEIARRAKEANDAAGVRYRDQINLYEDRSSLQGGDYEGVVQDMNPVTINVYPNAADPEAIAYNIMNELAAQGR